VPLFGQTPRELFADKAVLGKTRNGKVRRTKESAQKSAQTKSAQKSAEQQNPRKTRIGQKKSPAPDSFRNWSKNAKETQFTFPELVSRLRNLFQLLF
jgi:hypothetical protein